MSGEALTPLTPSQREQFGWLDADYLKKVIAALESAQPGSARFVGGCVRDSLFGCAPKDFDVATILTPPRVIDALHKAGLRAAPTGIDHGTITAIADHQGVEITTLRADVSTDGRRATVAFTEDWRRDAQRRDFTINAIYLTPDGKIFDPEGGVADVSADLVQFIGDPVMRICEDYLRILRFFRFSARFSKSFDKAGLEACQARREGIKKLSAERIGAEFMSILSLSNAPRALKAMKECGVLSMIWETPADISAVQRLKAIAPASGAPVILAALFGAAGEGVSRRLRLSNAEKSIRATALKGAARISPNQDEQSLHREIYGLGRDVFFDSAALSFSFEQINEAEFMRLSNIVGNWRPPEFPVSGRHIIERGLSAGPQIARILAAVERQWINEDFPDAARLDNIVTEQIASAEKL